MTGHFSGVSVFKFRAFTGIFRVFPRLLFAGASLVGMTVVWGVAVSQPASAAIVSFSEVRDQYTMSEGVLYDRHHQVLQELRVDKRGRRLDWVALGDISPSLKQAVVESEDRSFWRHHGVDWLALGRAAARDILRDLGRDSGRPGRLQGASTLSMQLASILDASRLSPRSQGHRSISQKIRQLAEARDLERTWSKDQIFEAYLNRVSFRGELQGISAASRGLFGKAPHGLNRAESVVLAALIRSPEAELCRVRARSCELGTSLWKSEFDCASLEEPLQRQLSRQPISSDLALAPHVAARLLGSAKNVDSTLDRDLQSQVTELLRTHVLSEVAHNMHDGAALVLDNRSGEVLAYVGGIGERSSARFVDGVRALRQAGSTLKPFLYADALDRRYLTADSLLEDSPTDFPVLGGVYRPRNYDNEFHGKVSVRSALAASLNVPAVRALQLVGVDDLTLKLKQLGFSGLRSADYYGPSLALGAADISLWDLTNAYRALANGGRWSAARLVTSLSGSKVTSLSTASTDLASGPPLASASVYSPSAAFIISDILSDRESRSLTFGLENPLSLSFWTAVKTGTSKDMRDNWCVGYSQYYTVGVWAGNSSGEPMWNVSGVSGAAPVWAEIMKRLHAREPSHGPAAPQGVRRVAVEGGREEWFIVGTEPFVEDVGAFPRLLRMTG